MKKILSIPLLSRVLFLALSPLGVSSGLGADEAASKQEVIITASPEAGGVSLEAALAEARDVLAKKPGTAVTVRLTGGTYRIRETIVLGAGDSGLKLAAAPEARPVISGGVPLTGWERSTELPPGVPEAVRDQVWEAPIPAGVPVPNMLYDQDGILPMAAGPEFKPAIDDKDPRTSDRVLYTPAGVLQSWTNPQDILISIIPRRQWSHNVLRVEDINLKEGYLKTAVPCSYEMVRLSNQRDRSSVRILNAPETLDEAGEWFVDSKARRIYHLPRDGKMPGNSIVVPTLYELLRIEGTLDAPARNITVEGITFQHTLRREWEADEKCVQHDWESVDTANGIVRLRNATDCVIRECLITMGGSTGVRFDMLAQRNTLENCEVSVLGGNGVFLGGLFFDSRDINRENVIRNNHVWATGLVKYDGCGILVTQSGANRIQNNLVHDTGYSGVVLSGILNVAFGPEGWPERRELGRLLTDDFLREAGLERETASWDRIEQYLYSRDNIVEDNELFDTVKRCGDGNPIYLRGAGPRNVIRRNFVHHNYGRTVYGGIRMDDGQWGTTVEENVVYLTTWSGITLKGVNRVINNVVIDVLAKDDPLNSLEMPCQGFLEYRVNLPIHNLGQPPVGESEIRNNILLNTRDSRPLLLGFLDRSKAAPSSPEEGVRMLAADIRPPGALANNLYWDVKDPAFARIFVTPGNQAADPQLAAPLRGDVRFPSDSPAAKMGIVPLDVTRMGLRVDDFPKFLRNRLPKRPGDLSAVGGGE